MTESSDQGRSGAERRKLIEVEARLYRWKVVAVTVAVAFVFILFNWLRLQDRFDRVTSTRERLTEQTNHLTASHSSTVRTVREGAMAMQRCTDALQIAERSMDECRQRLLTCQQAVPVLSPLVPPTPAINSRLQSLRRRTGASPEPTE